MEKQPISKKPLFNLNLVIQETGIKADTLRAWERRYRLPTPSRTEGGHRLFSSYDIETIKWLLARQEDGMRISQAVDYWRELLAAGIDPLEGQARELTAAPTLSPAEITLQPLDDLLEQWIEYSLAFDEEKAEGALDAAFKHFPWEAVCRGLIYRGMAEIGERWYTADITVQQEHFASELIVRKLQSLIASAPPAYHPQKALISNPPGEFHTIAPLTLNLLLRFKGWEVTYLGANVPYVHLRETLESIQPNLVIMTAARLSTAAALLDVKQLLDDYQIPLAFGGNVFTELPGLEKRIPGTYLGDDLGEAVSLAEKLLSDPIHQPLPTPPPNPYHDLLIQLQGQLPILENQALQVGYNESQGEFSGELFQEINNFLLQDILAALKIGDLNYLEYNLTWVNSLLKSRGHDIDLLTQYLASFMKIVQKKSGQAADPLLAWLEEYLKRI